jgi:4-hydroxy-tetrahydrodipicolinate synthase
MRRQVDACIGAGAHGIAILGIVGEFNKMDVNERRILLDIVADAVRGRVPLAVTVVEPSVPGQIGFMRAAEEAGADWVILQPPPIKGIPEAELVRFFAEVAARANVPVAIQNNPVNLDVWLTNTGLRELRRAAANVTLLKNEGPVTAVKETIVATDAGFDVFCGLGGRELTMSLRAGCVGCVPAPDLVDIQVRIYELMREGKDKSQVLADELLGNNLPLIQFLLHSPAHMLHYGKHLFAERIGVGTVNPRAPTVIPTEFGHKVVAHYASHLPPLLPATG